MDNIKFRVWCKTKKEWETDECMLTTDGRLMHLVPRTSGFVELKRDTHDVEMLVDTFEGVEVYEGDKVKSSAGTFEVRYNKKRCAFMLFNIIDEMYFMNVEPYVYRHYYMFGFEVTGNIHDGESK